SIEAPGNPGLARDARQRLPRSFAGNRIRSEHALRVRVGIDGRIDDHHFEGAFLIPVVAWERLVFPDHFAGLRPNGKTRVGAGHGAANRSTLRLRCRSRAARSVKDKIEFGIVGERAPDARHPALVIGSSAPGLVAGLARFGNELVAPEFFAIARIVPGDVATEPGHLTGTASDDHAVDDNRTAGILHEE